MADREDVVCRASRKDVADREVAWWTWLGVRTLLVLRP
jgi:hypothetical protein